MESAISIFRKLPETKTEVKKYLLQIQLMEYIIVSPEGARSRD